MSPRALTLTGLHIYPVKSCHGIDLQKMRIGKRGPENDRRWMIVDDKGNFLSQRRHPKMALIKTTLVDSGLSLNAPGMPECMLPVRTESEVGEKIKVNIWSDQVNAVNCGEDASRWLSRFMDLPCRLVTMEKDFVRPVDADYASVESQVSFADV
ncbi:MAG: MOSC N-terminal beta barrel domain-containing protein, partial [Nitrospinales bacterium]